MSRRLGIAVFALTSALVAAPLEVKAAGVPEMLRSGTRPWQVLLGIGPAWAVGTHGGHDLFKLTQEIAGHFRGDASGPALGILLSEEFKGNFFEFAVAPKLTLDLQPRRGLGLYVSPNLAIDYRFMSEKFQVPGSISPWQPDPPEKRRTHHGATLQVGVALKLMLDDRWIVWLQPLHFDLAIQPYTGSCFDPAHSSCAPTLYSRLALLFGGGVSF